MTDNKDRIDRVEELVGDELEGKSAEELKQEAREKWRQAIVDKRREIEWAEVEIELPRLLLEELKDTASEMGYEGRNELIVDVLNDAVRHPDFDRRDLKAMLAGEAEIQEGDTVHGDAVKIKHLPPSGRRISPLTIREWVEGRGNDPQHVAEEYELPLADVYAALAYYHENPEEMEELRAERERAAEELREEIEEERPDDVEPDSNDSK